MRDGNGLKFRKSAIMKLFVLEVTMRDGNGVFKPPTDPVTVLEVTMRDGNQPKEDDTHKHGVAVVLEVTMRDGNCLALLWSICKN